MTPFMALGLFILVFLIASIAFKVPMAFTMGLVCIFMIIFTGQPPMIMASTAFAALDSFPFLAIPFFVFAGSLMQYSGISTSLVNFIQSIVGRVRGSIGAITVLACAAFGVLTGSTLATLSSIGKVMVPELVKRGYKKDYASALAASSSFLGILIPPSVPGIFYALAAGQNIANVWLSTIGPAILIAAGYITLNYFIVGRHEKKNEEPFKLNKYFRNIGSQGKSAFAALIMPIIIFGGIYGGIFTPTEAGAVCAVYGVIFLLIKQFRGGGVERNLWQITTESATLTAVIALSISFSTGAGKMLTMTGVSNALSQFLSSNVQSPLVFLLMCNILFLFMGMLVDINITVLIMTPILIPSVQAYGINLIHFGAMMLVNLCVGYLTPPMAGAVFHICRLVGGSFIDVVKRTWPFLLVGLTVVALTTLFPVLSTIFILGLR